MSPFRSAQAVPGAGTLNVSVTGPDGFALLRSYALDVRPATQIPRAAACARWPRARR